jgi:transcriptional regulator with XRE-family HTH domain
MSKINLNFYKECLKKAGSKYNGGISEKGTIIKMARLKAKLRLADVCKDICSISFLSKVENNIIDIDDEQFDKIMRRLNLDLTAEKLREMNQPKVENVFNCLMNGTEILEESFKEYRFTFNMVSATNCLIKKDYNNFEKEVRGLYEGLELCSVEVIDYAILLLVIYYFNTGYYYYSLVIARSLNNPNSLVGRQVNFYRARCSYYLKNSTEINTITRETTLNVISSGDTEMLYELTKLQNSYRICSDTIKNIAPSTDPDKIAHKLYLQDLLSFKNIIRTKTSEINLSRDESSYGKCTTDDERLLTLMILDLEKKSKEIIYLCRTVKSDNMNISTFLTYLYEKYYSKTFNGKIVELYYNKEFDFQNVLVLLYVYCDFPNSFKETRSYKEIQVFQEYLARKLNLYCDLIG